MPDVNFQLKKSKESLSNFQRKLHRKMTDRSRMEDEAKALQNEINRLKSVEQKLERKKSEMDQVDREIKNMQSQKMRLLREMPHLEHEMRKMELERRFGKDKGKPVGIKSGE